MMAKYQGIPGLPWLRVSAVVGCLFLLPVQAGDWPMWRYDSSRRGSTPHGLADDLFLQWTHEFPEPRPAWPPQTDQADKLEFDLAHHPIVYNGMVYVTSSANDCLYALDLASGEERWRFYAEGPFRLAAAAWQGRVYAVSDDGWLYALDAASGELDWRFRGAPATRRMIGNHRLISPWAARGGPVVHEEKVYFAAGVFPLMGIFVHALDARTGEVVWSNSGSGAEFISQPHASGSFAGVSPQGYLAVDGDKLIVSGGRSRPAVYCRKSGDFLYFEIRPRPAGKQHPSLGGPMYGGYDVIAGGGFFYVHGEMHRTGDGAHVGWLGRHALSVVSQAGDMVFGIQDDSLVCYDPAPVEVEVTNRQGQSQLVLEPRLNWKIDRPQGMTRIHLQAGSRLYGSGSDGRIFAVEPTGRDEALSEIWQQRIEGNVWTMAAAGGHLLVMTEEGQLHAFGPVRPEQPVRHRRQMVWPEPGYDRWTVLADRVLAELEPGAGYALVVGLEEGRLVEELLRQSELYVIMIDPDPERIAAVRKRLDRAGLYGDRAAAVTAAFPGAGLSPYLADLIVSERPAHGLVGQVADYADELFSALRPYGGMIWLELAQSGQNEFEQWFSQSPPAGGQIDRLANGGIRLVRAGPLPGAGWWTHQNADSSNSGISTDSLVRAPLGLLWFGGPDNRNVLPRHGRGPVPQVVGGRLFILGPDTLQARDVYTGRKLWLRSFPGIGSYYDTWSHQPGADQVGAPYVSLEDGVYIAYKSAILRLDPLTGKTLDRFLAPVEAASGESPDWGFISAWEDLLVAAVDPLFFDDQTPGGRNWNSISSRRLVVLNRHSGEYLWSREAEMGFRHNAIVTAGGRVYLIDRLPEEVREYLQRRGDSEPLPRLLSLEARTGELVWQYEREVFGTWLGYSQVHDILLQSGRPAVDRRQSLTGEPADRMAAFSGRDGSLLWDREVSYRNAPLIHGNSVITHGRALSLLTGEDQVREHALTGELIPWRYDASRNCGQIIGSQHLLTFRRGSASYYDLQAHSGTGNMGGFRAGCTPNLVPADGVVNAPDYTRSCTCSYQLQTSLALIPMPEIEGWTFGGLEPIGRLARLGGVNLGAPGNRQHEDTLWLAYPGRGTASALSFSSDRGNPATGHFLKHPLYVEAGRVPWVSSSGLVGEADFTMVLNPDPEAGGSLYTIKLYFLEPDPEAAGRRRFNVLLQDREVLREFDILQEAGGPRRELVKKFTGVKADAGLRISLRSADNSELPPLLCGIEFVLED